MSLPTAQPRPIFSKVEATSHKALPSHHSEAWVQKSATMNGWIAICVESSCMTMIPTLIMSTVSYLQTPCRGDCAEIKTKDRK